MNRLPTDFQRELRLIHQSAEIAEGWMSSREMDLLALFAAYPTCMGDILELGSFRGKSTIILAKAALLADQARVTTVDPAAGEVLEQNLQRAGVDQQVEVHKAFSWDVIPHWQRPLRLLWHDGANTHDVVSQDVEGLLPHLQDGAIVAFHDVLNSSGDRIRVFAERILDSEDFGAAGVCGSIGWGQFRSEPEATAVFRQGKQVLRRRLEKLIPYHSATGPWPRGFSKIRYKLLRSRVPHGAVDQNAWVKLVSTE